MELFGTTFRETKDVLWDLNPRKTDDTVTAVGRIVVSIVLSVVGAYLMFIDEGKTQMVGSSLLGAVVGYWLR